MSDIPSHILRDIELVKSLAAKFEAALPMIERVATGAETAAGAIGLGDAAKSLHDRIDNVVTQLKTLQEFREKAEQILEQVAPLIEELKPILAGFKSAAGAAAAVDDEAPPVLQPSA